jgi:glucose/arabinose dehydrogenase
MSFGASAMFGQPVQLVNAFPNLTFTQPIFLTHSNDGTNRIFVVQKNGLIRVFPNDSTVTSAPTFLNLSSRIITGSGGDERGLLGLAFHRNYSSNGYFFVDYTQAGNGRSIIARYKVDSLNPNQGDFNSEVRLLQIYQPFTNHNGGILFFGQDGYLYDGKGDGGSAGDPGNRAQNVDSLLGKILRINVDTTIGSQNYGIPSTNPFAGGGGRPEIFAWGMRNPWRMSQDPVTGLIWCGDVGQDVWEEIDLIGNGRNYGWRCYEGNATYSPTGCGNISQYTFPIKVYQHTGGRCSITGGYVYRGSRRPDLVGRYIYADYCTGEIWKLKYEGGVVTEDSLLVTAPTSVLSFGTDQNNELYILGNNGIIYRFNRSGSQGVGGELHPSRFALEQNYPNPFNPTTNIQFTIINRQLTILKVYDVLGRVVATLVNETKSPGSYEVEWNAEGVSSGMYFYRLAAGPFVETCKMLVVK